MVTGEVQGADRAAVNSLQHSEHVFVPMMGQRFFNGWLRLRLKVSRCPIFLSLIPRLQKECWPGCAMRMA